MPENKDLEVLRTGATIGLRWRSGVNKAIGQLLTTAAARLHAHPEATGPMTERCVSLALEVIEIELRDTRAAMRSAAGTEAYISLKSYAKRLQALVTDPDLPRTGQGFESVEPYGTLANGEDL